MDRFTRLRLENWKNFPEVDVQLAERVFLLGPNASGKSNFLDVFRFLSDIAAERGGGLQYAITLKRGGLRTIRSLSARRRSDVTVEAEMVIGGKKWIYMLEISRDKSVPKRPVVKREIVKCEGETLCERPDEFDKRDPERLRQTHLEQIVMNEKFRDVVNFFRSIRYFHVVPQMIRHPERVMVSDQDPFGSDFITRIDKLNKRTQDAWIKRVSSALKKVVPQYNEMKIVSKGESEDGIPHLIMRHKHWRPKAGWQDERQLSDGTLRLLGIFWALLLEGNGPCLLEEPELSLHPEVVRILPSLIGELQVKDKTSRQVIMSTYSLDMLRDEGVKPDEVLVLRTEREGTKILPMGLEEYRTKINSGVALADLVQSLMSINLDYLSVD